MQSRREQSRKEFLKSNAGVMTAVLAAALVLLPVAGAFAGSGDYGAKGALEQAGQLDLTLEEMLRYALQDEYLARAEYELIMKEYGTMRPFSNIMSAEERHIQWVTELYEKYGFEMPADISADHVVLPPDLKTAFETGVQAEIDNIAMYESFLKASDLPDDVRKVFEELKRGSENHLRAFRNNLARYK